MIVTLAPENTLPPLQRVVSLPSVVELAASGPEFLDFVDMFGGYTEVAAYYVNTPWPEAGEEEAGAGPLPSDYVPLYHAPDPWYKLSVCPKDFIMIAEFSEQEGPKPLVGVQYKK